MFHLLSQNVVLVRRLCFKVTEREKQLCWNLRQLFCGPRRKKNRNIFLDFFILDRLNPETAGSWLEKCSYPMKMSSEVLWKSLPAGQNWKTLMLSICLHAECPEWSIWCQRASCSVMPCCTFVPFGMNYAVKSLINEEEHVKAAKSGAAPWVTGDLVSECGNRDTVAVQMGAITAPQRS